MKLDVPVGSAIVSNMTHMQRRHHVQNSLIDLPRMTKMLRVTFYSDLWLAVAWPSFMNCLLYARVSTDKQAQKELSIPAQLEMMTQYARKSGWKIIGRYVDRGESARTANRPELKRLIQHCRENKGVDIVLVHKIDRLSRNLIDYATIKAILKQKGIRLVSVSDPSMITLSATSWKTSSPASPSGIAPTWATKSAKPTRPSSRGANGRTSRP